MMTAKTPTWYQHAGEQLALYRASCRWIETPFRENSAVPGPGGGVSCHNLVAELYFESGFLERFPVPTGSARRLKNGPADALLSYIDANLADSFAPIDPDEESAIAGDLIVMRDARMVCHLGVMTGGDWFIHVLPFSGVLRSIASDPTFGKRIVYIRRPKPRNTLTQ